MPFDFCNFCISNVSLESHHCTKCDRCVYKLDHHCDWMNNCIAEGNYHYFILSVVFVLALSIFLLITNILNITDFFNYNNEYCKGFNEYFMKGIPFSYIIFGSVCNYLMLILSVFLGYQSGKLLIYHINLKRYNLTTLEKIIIEKLQELLMNKKYEIMFKLRLSSHKTLCNIGNISYNEIFEQVYENKDLKAFFYDFYVYSRTVDQTDNEEGRINSQNKKGETCITILDRICCCFGCCKKTRVFESEIENNNNNQSSGGFSSTVHAKISKDNSSL